MTAVEFHRARLRLDRTQVELGRMLGVTSTSVSRYETGLREISDTVAILLRLLVKLYAEDQPAAARRRRVVHPSSNGR